MSYRVYPFHIPCALIIDDETLELLCKKVKMNTIEDSTWDIVETLRRSGLPVEFHTDVECAVIPFNKYNLNESYYLNSDTVVYIESARYPDFFKAAYKNYKELLDEFNEVIKDWLPEDFPTEQHLWQIIGAVYS